MTNATQTAADLFATFAAVYDERMTAAALISVDAMLLQMVDARGALVGLLGCTRVEAQQLVHGLQVLFGERMGVEAPADYRAALVEVLAA